MMSNLTRKQVIDNLIYMMDSMPDDACADWRDSLAYAIESLKVDEAYQIMYEGGEIFTKDEVISMFESVQKKMEEYEPRWVENDEQAVASCRTWEDLDEIVKECISSLRGNTNEN